MATTNGTICVLVERRIRFPRVPRESRLVFFAAGWACLLIACMECRDVLLFLITFPLILVSLGIAALLWRSPASAWGKVSTLCYWVIVGVIRFGMIVALTQAIETHVHPPEMLPPRPHVEIELVFWAVPALIIWVSLSLSRHCGGIGIAIPVTLLVLLNPAILLMVAWLQPSMGM